MELPSSKIQALFNKVLRFPFIVFLKRYMFVLLFFLIFLLTNIFGLWNVKNITFLLPQDANTDINILEQSLDTVKGSNIFFVSGSDIQDVLKSKNEFVKNVTVEKKIPSTLEILIKEHTPFFVGYSSNRCLLFSNEGKYIKELCTECDQECKEYLNIYSTIYIASNFVLENNGFLIYQKEITDILEILSIFGYNIKNISIEDGISTFESIDDHMFIFDISEDLDIQLSRMYIVGKKVNSESMEFKSIDLRFKRPVMKLR